MCSVSPKTIMFRYMPLAGGGSFIAFSANIMDPKLFGKWFAPYEVSMTNAIWFQAHLGLGLHLYSRPHMAVLPTYKRVGFSVFGTALFNFGSVLLWATTKSLLPECKTLRIIVGLSSGLLLLFVGNEYVKSVDDQVATE